MTGSKKNLSKHLDISLTALVIRGDELPIKRQCELLGLNRSNFYYKPILPSNERLAYLEALRKRIDYYHTKHPYMGFKKIAKKVSKGCAVFAGINIGKKLTKTLMREMNIFTIYPKPNLSKPNKQHRKFPYLLKNKSIEFPNQVWAIDITYIRMGKAHMYLTAIIDWYSRFIVGWALSDSLETAPVLDAIKLAINKYGVPAIINSDQGAQFTSDDYIELLQQNGIHISMDGKARWIDNVIIERWFRSLKCDNIYITEYNTPRELRVGIKQYIHEYNNERPHQSLNYEYPSTAYHYLAA
jgi:putative transposase